MSAPVCMLRTRMRHHLAMRIPRGEGWLLVAFALTVLIGLSCIALGAWSLLYPPPDWLPRRLAIMPVAVGVGGVVVIGLALLEVGQRLWRGPQPPGRHARPDDG